MFKKIYELAKKNNNNCILSIIGAGGKTSFMYAFAKYLVKKKKKSIISTTTKIFADVNNKNIKNTYFSRTFEQFYDIVMKFNNDKLICIVNKQIDNKLIGLNDKWIDKVSFLCQNVNILLEADGAKNLPFKAHNENEPIIPMKSTAVIIIIGADIIDKPLNSKYVHRVELFMSKTDKKVGDIISIEIIVDYVQKFWLTKIPDNMPKVVFINKIDSYNKAISLGKEIRKIKNIEYVFVGSIFTNYSLQII